MKAGEREATPAWRSRSATCRPVRLSSRMGQGGQGDCDGGGVVPLRGTKEVRFGVTSGLCVICGRRFSLDRFGLVPTHQPPENFSMKASPPSLPPET